MPDLLPVTIDGHTIYIETESTYGSEDTTSVEETVQRAGDAFVRAQATVTAVAKGMVEAVRRLDRASTPDEFTMEIAIKFNAEGTAILARAGAEANLRITMKYTRDKDTTTKDGTQHVNS